MFLSKIIRLLTWWLAFVLISCTSDSADVLYSTNDAAAEAFYDSDLQAIIEEKCISCHEYHLEGSTRYDSFSKTKSSIAQIIQRVNSSGNNIMPPTDATPLTTEELETFNNFLSLLTSTDSEQTASEKAVQVNWLSYKYPNFDEREAVGGTFDELTFLLNTNYNDIIHSLEEGQVTINTSSVNVANNDALRSSNVATFFEYFTDEITGNVISYTEDEAVIAFTMNGITRNITLSVAVDNAENRLTLTGSIPDLSLFNWQAGHDALQAICGAFHENKLWPDVDIEIILNLDNL